MFEKSKLAKAIVNDEAEMIRQIGRRKGAHFFHESLSDYGYPISRALRMDKRAALDAFSETVMAAVASGLPDAQRGRYAADPAARTAAEAVSAFPFHAPELRGM